MTVLLARFSLDDYALELLVVGDSLHLLKHGLLRFSGCSDGHLELVVHGEMFYFFALHSQSIAIVDLTPLVLVEDKISREDVPVTVGRGEIRASLTQVDHQTLAQATADKNLLAELLKSHQCSLLAGSSFDDFCIEIAQRACVLEERSDVSVLVPDEQILALLVCLLCCNLDLLDGDVIPAGNINA